MSHQSATMFFDRFYSTHKDRAMLMIEPKFVPFEPGEYDEAPDAIVSIEGSDRTWSMHSKALSSHSNFFRRAFSGKFREAGTKEIKLHEIKLHEIKEVMVEFIMRYVYEGWYPAIYSVVGVQDDIPQVMPKIAEIMLVADYLDMPNLCYQAYRRIQTKISRIVVDARSNIQFQHYIFVKQQPFLKAARILAGSGTPLGVEYAKNIRTFFRNLRGKNALPEALAAFCEAFEDDFSIVELELQW
ncbi:hypothetical protein F5Y11DRAFT_363131 [Daldinia sp. FL1419]|nr:hypothetical protein F5Y11DRAFT_363131 [Daldinia sp. FL1419]